MLGFLIVAASVCFVRGDLLPSAGNFTGSSCEDGDFEADQTLANCNGEMNYEDENNQSVDYYGFDTAVGVYAFGLELPMSISLSVSHGNLTGIGKMVRCSSAVSCSTNNTNSLEGIFGYTSELSLSYAVAKAKFLFWEVQGKFVFKPKPKMHVFLLNETSSCRMESISMEDPGQTEYVFDYGSESVMGWLISKLLVRGLEQKDDTWLMEQMELWIQAMMATYFVEAWCHPDWASRH